ncbi:RNA 2',3'-cyclic phosphodiesterase [Candidatus Woesearchaeota archaeon]|nr:RNA 2',3'-cyclic phosphodiesterase [Candidatus Woesearchaeota archaeon]
MRLFIAIDFNEFSDYFKELQKQLPEARHTLPKKFHLTLKFLGEVDENKVDKIKQLLSEVKFKEFNCELNNIAHFAGNFIKTVFVKITDSENIRNLQKQIDTKLEGLFEKEKSFESHITIARVKHVENKKEYLENLGKIKTDKIPKKVSSFELIKSLLTPEGPVYEVLGQFKAVP